MPNRKILVLISAITMLIGIFLLDIFVRPVEFFWEGAPAFDLRNIIRTFLIMLTSWLCVIAIIQLRPSARYSAVDDALSVMVQKWILTTVVLIAVFFMSAFQFSPQFFNSLVLEE